MFKLSEYYIIYEEDLKSIIQQLNLKLRTKEYLAQQEQVKLMVQEAGKCIQQMQMELSTLSLQQKLPLERTLNQYRQQLALIEKQVKVTEKDSKPLPDQNLRSDLIENDKIIDEIDILTQETQNIAIAVNQRMGDGTQALHSAKYKKEELKSNVRKADLIISMMNRKITVDKGSLYIIIILLGIIDILALYKKIY